MMEWLKDSDEISILFVYYGILINPSIYLLNHLLRSLLSYLFNRLFFTSIIEAIVPSQNTSLWRFYCIAGFISDNLTHKIISSIQTDDLGYRQTIIYELRLVLIFLSSLFIFIHKNF